MNSMEERTREGLHQAADRLVVAEDDLDRMEDDLMSLLLARPTQQYASPRRQRDWLVAAVAVVALVLAGVALWEANDESQQTQPAGRLAPPPTQQRVPPELVGLWQATPDSSWLWEFTAEGRVLSTEGVDGYLRGAVDVRGGDGALVVTVLRTGSTYVMTEYAGSTPAPSGTGCNATRIRFVGAETISLDDGCGGDPGDGLRLERVSPRDPGAPALVARFRPGPVRLVTAGSQLEGSWLDTESGRVLVVGRRFPGDALTYVLDDDGDGSVRPDQRGVLTVGGDGSVRPQPRTGTAGGCAPEFARAVSTVATMVTTSAANGCSPPGSNQSWLRLN